MNGDCEKAKRRIVWKYIAYAARESACVYERYSLRLVEIMIFREPHVKPTLGCLVYVDQQCSVAG